MEGRWTKTEVLFPSLPCPGFQSSGRAGGGTRQIRLSQVPGRRWAQPVVAFGRAVAAPFVLVGGSRARTVGISETKRCAGAAADPSAEAQAGGASAGSVPADRHAGCFAGVAFEAGHAGGVIQFAGGIDGAGGQARGGGGAPGGGPLVVFAGARARARGVDPGRWAVRSVPGVGPGAPAGGVFGVPRVGGGVVRASRMGLGACRGGARAACRCLGGETGGGGGLLPLRPAGRIRRVALRALRPRGGGRVVGLKPPKTAVDDPIRPFSARSGKIRRPATLAFAI